MNAVQLLNYDKTCSIIIIESLDLSLHVCSNLIFLLLIVIILLGRVAFLGEIRGIRPSLHLLVTFCQPVRK